MSTVKRFARCFYHLLPYSLRRKIRRGAYLLVQEDLEARLAPYGGLFGVLQRVDNLEIGTRALRNDLKWLEPLRLAFSLHTINRDHVLSDILLCDYNGVTGKDEPGGVIVSLTSYPARMYDLHFTLHSLLSQSFKPERVVLWLGKEQFPTGRASIPKLILDMERRGLEIRFCKDIRSFTKLLPALGAFPGKTIVTADDDIYYDTNWLERLMAAHASAPSAIWALRAYRIKASREGGVSSYNDWSLIIQEGAKPSFNSFFTGCGGVLYPPGALHEDVSNIEAIQRIAPFNDDIWFWAMAVRKGSKIGVLPGFSGYLTYTNSLRESGLNGDDMLANKNVRGGKNDEQLHAVFAAYPEVFKSLISEVSNLSK